jgi:hypothetical protein
MKEDHRISPGRSLRYGDYCEAGFQQILSRHLKQDPRTSFLRVLQLTVVVSNVAARHRKDFLTKFSGLLLCRMLAIHIILKK